MEMGASCISFGYCFFFLFLFVGFTGTGSYMSESEQGTAELHLGLFFYRGEKRSRARNGICITTSNLWAKAGYAARIQELRLWD
jgi:hypothetical protein